MMYFCVCFSVLGLCSQEIKTDDVTENEDDSSSTDDIEVIEIDDTQVDVLKLELKKTKDELIILKREHTVDMTHLHNRITHLKTQEMSAKSREISMRVTLYCI